MILDHIRTLFNTFQAAFELISEDNRPEVHIAPTVPSFCSLIVGIPQVEPSIVSSFLELVVKLNETAFRPLFRKFSDWAFSSQGGWSFFTLLL